MIDGIVIVGDEMLWQCLGESLIEKISNYDGLISSEFRPGEYSSDLIIVRVG